MEGIVDTLGLQGITGRFLGASDDYIADVEKECGFCLPSDYRNFLSCYGASLFGKNLGFKPLVASPWAVDGIESFDVFYGMSENPRFDVRRINARLREVVGVDLLAIGHDAGSNLILVSSNGEVWFLDRESGRRFLSARSFTNFLDSFKAPNSGKI